MVLFSEEKINNGGDNCGNSEEKRISGEAYDVNEQTVYIAPKAKISSRVHYALEPALMNASEDNQCASNHPLVNVHALHR